jgi:oxygen-independent coproporphyrinogen-3 oxidase
MTSLYVHIPFCRKKCRYCDFVSYAGKESLIDPYVEALTREIEGLGDWGAEGLKTIYFGGGTPTLLEPRHFNKIISSIICHLSLDIGHSELSIEANPGTADKKKLRMLRQLGLNRLSIGVQSFNDRHLKTLGRIHSAKEAIKFYEDARAAGFEDINLDLIFALPNQTLAEWKNDLIKAINLMPNHLSTYNLQIEEGTPLWEMANAPSSDMPRTRTFSQGEKVPARSTLSLWERVRVLRGSGEGFNLPTEDEELAMYEYTIETLTANGYKHYEISNFAKPGYECRHNINYWKNGNYIGLGAGAHSHVNDERWANSNSIEEYIKETATFNRRFPSKASDRGEMLFMGLRLLEGLPTEKLAGFEKEVSELINDGLLERNSGHCRLTRRGLYLGNLVFEKFV